MRKFKNINAKTVNEALSALNQYKDKAAIIAGGTDLLGIMKNEVLPEYPEVLVNIKSIPELNYIKEEGGVLKIGATALLEDVAVNSTINKKYNALAQAAHKTASPHLREMGTIAGNICQMNRCWYFRNPKNTFYCLRKGGGICYALAGDNRYHNIFGAISGCVAVNCSDIAPALVALNATIKTSKRDIAAEDFWTVPMMQPESTVLDKDEIVTEIQIPEPAEKSAFMKFAIRKSIDFPIVNCASMVNGEASRICLNAVKGIPYRVIKAEDAIAGKTIDEDSAEAAGLAAIQGSTALPGVGQAPGNKYKIQIAKILVKRTILACK